MSMFEKIANTRQENTVGTHEKEDEGDKLNQGYLDAIENNQDKETLSYILNEMKEDSSSNYFGDSKKYYFEGNVLNHYLNLSLKAKLYLLNHCANMLSEDFGSNRSGFTDASAIANWLLEYATREDNFFVSGFAKSFFQVNYLAEETDKIEKFYRPFKNDYAIEINNWLSNRSDKEYEKNFVTVRSISEYSRICPVSSDFNALYSGDKGQLLEYLDSSYTETENVIDAYDLRQSYFEIKYLLKNTFNVLVENWGDIPSVTAGALGSSFEIITFMPDDLQAEVRFFLSECKSFQENTQFNQENQEKLNDSISAFTKKAEYLLESIDYWFLEYIKVNNLVKEPLNIENFLDVGKDSNEAELAYIHELFASKRMRQHMEKYFGFKYEELTLKTQIMFINYVLDKDNKEVDKVQNFISSVTTEKEKVDRFRTFLSLEHYDKSLGDVIVSFGSTHESAGEVFASYGVLLDEVDKFEDFVHHELVCDQENCKELIKKARERLLFDANSYLANSVSSNNPDTVVEVLNQKKVEAKALSAAIMTYMSTVGSSIEDFNSFHKNTYDNNIDPQLLDELKNIYIKNYQNIGYDKEAVDSLVENLEKKIYSDDTKIKTWEFGNDKILAFTAVTENQQDKSAYISGLNVNPDLKTAKAAKSLLEETISEYSEKGFVIKAEATADNFQGYGEMDWVATALKDDDLGQENFLFDIAIYPTQKFFSKSLTKKEIKEMVLNTDEYIGSDGMVVVKNPDILYLNNMLEKGYVVTRYFKTRKITETGQKEEIFVLEKLDETMNYSTATQTQNVA